GLERAGADARVHRAAAAAGGGRAAGRAGVCCRPQRLRDPALRAGLRPRPPAHRRGAPAQAEVMTTPSTAPGQALQHGVRHIHRHFHRIAWLAVALALGVIVFGAFVRLSHAGLSCPDWPTCYGRATWPKALEHAADHAASTIRAFEDHKAWREQVHRHIAARLGVLVLVMALLAARRRRLGIAQVLAAAGLVAVAIPTYMAGAHVAASLLAIAGEAILIAAALRWRGRDLGRESALTLAVIIFQALLGMRTVTGQN